MPTYAKGTIRVGDQEFEVTDIEVKFEPDKPLGLGIKGERIDTIEPSAVATWLADWPEVDPEPGYTWRECLCAEIDPSDIPCIICAARWPDGVPWFAIDLLTGDIIEREP